MNTNNNKKEDYVGLGIAKKIVHKPNVTVSPRIHANTLFKFMKKSEYLFNSLDNKRIFPRYLAEPVGYLKLGKIKYLAYPMSCFCDINMHNLDVHVERYGKYGIAFSKEWAKSKGIQPVQYINPNSELRKDFSLVFKQALKNANSDGTKTEEMYENYMLHEVMFYKPYEGKEKRKTICYIDECEWRFLPNVSIYGYKQIIPYNGEPYSWDDLDQLSNSLSAIDGIGLGYEYSDIKYLIVENIEDASALIERIQNYPIETQEKTALISKIIIWQDSKGDF